MNYYFYSCPTREALKCKHSCEDKFVSCARNKPSGCVEELRICRESCHSDPRS